MAKLYGYSERGLVNALFESVMDADRPLDLLKKLMGSAVAVCPGGEELDLSVAQDFEIYVEPSLSEFGNPDALVFLYLEPEAHPSDVIFVEAKLVPFLTSSRLIQSIRGEALDGRPEVLFGSAASAVESEEVDRFLALQPSSWPDETYGKNGSTILQELFLKARLVSFLGMSDGLKRLQEPGIGVYSADKGTRKIGYKDLVIQVARKIEKTAKSWFFALTPDLLPPADSEAPWLTGAAIRTMIDHINNQPLPSRCKPDDWKKRTYVWSWQAIWETASDTSEKSLSRLRETMTWNDQSFSYPSLRATDKWPDCVESLLRELGLVTKAPGSKSRRTYHVEEGARERESHKSTAVLTCACLHGCGGPELDVTLVGVADNVDPTFRLPHPEIVGFVEHGEERKGIAAIKSSMVARPASRADDTTLA